MNESTHTSMHIGQLAADLRIKPKTIRYYEAIGLLPQAPRTDAGYRLYGCADRHRLQFILKAKGIGFTLREIKELLALRDGGIEPCPHLGRLVDGKLKAIDTHLRLLTGVRAELVALRQETAVITCSSTAICGPIELHQATPRR